MTQNSGPLPLEQQVVRVDLGHGEETIPALDPKRMQQRSFLRYVAPPLAADDCFKGGTVSDWLEAASYITSDVEWMLGLPFDLFWCQVIFDTTLHSLLDSFLLHCPRLYDTDPLHPECVSKQLHLRNLMFLMIIRLTKNRSKQGFITDKVFGDILYENFIFDVPKLLDFISIYSGLNEAILSLSIKVVSAIFEFQPKYFNDLKEAMATIYKVLSGFQLQLGLDNDDELSHSDDDTANHPIRLSTKSNRKQPTQQELNDTLLYLVDFSSSLLCLLHVFPQAAGIMLQENMMQRLGKVVDVFLVLIKNDLESQENLKRMVNGVESCCVQICHFLLTDVVRRAQDQSIGSEFYMEVLSSLVLHTRLTHLYHQRYDLHKEVSLAQHSLHLDDAQVMYLKSQLDMVVGGVSSNAVKRTAPSSVAASIDQQREQHHTNASQNTTASDNVVHSATADIVHDLFPDKSRAYIDNCIGYFGSDHETIINAIVEDRVPDWIDDRPASVVEHDEATAPPLSKRPDIATEQMGFDPTEGYLIRKNRDPKQEEWHALLSERSRNEIEKTLELCDMYDDEYDDTYDLRNIGVLDADSADELGDLTRRRRQFVIPQVLRQPGDYASSSENEDEDDRTKEDEELARLREREANASSSRRHYKPQRDVVTGLGNNETPLPDKSKRNTGHTTKVKKDKQAAPPTASSQGENKPNEEKKPAKPKPTEPAHHAKGSNIKYKKHNRRAMADKKRSQGMGPLG